MGSVREGATTVAPIALTLMVMLVVGTNGCASPASILRDGGAAEASDSAGTVWGDEYEGLAVDGGDSARAMPRVFNIEWVDGETQSARVDAFAHGAAIHARSYPSGEVGSVSWGSDGVLREVVAGDFTPAIAEGALIGDPRTGGDLRAPGTTRMQGLAMRSSTSLWSSMRGGGVVLGARAFRLSLGGWEALDDANGRVGIGVVEHVTRDGVVAVAGAASDTRRAAVSLFWARDMGSAFTGGELALADHRVRAVARMTNREWSAIAIAGAGPANDAPLVFARKERWGAALERRDQWGWGTSRAGASSLTRRDVVSDIRRRRAFWDGEWRVKSDTRLQLAARVTREENTRPVNGALASLPSHEVVDDWRARATLRVGSVMENGWLTDNSYRIEWVQNRTGKPGIIATWAWRLRAGALDTKFSASAHALENGQVSYSTDTAPPGLVEYSTVTGKGATLSASFRLWLRHHAWLGAAWSERPPTASRMWITLGLRG